MDFSQCLSSWSSLLHSSLSSWSGAPLLWCRFWLPVPPTRNVLYHHSFNKYMHLLQCNTFDTFDMHTIEYVTIRTVYFDTSEIEQIHVLIAFMHVHAFITLLHSVQFIQQIHVLTKIGRISRCPACPGRRGWRVSVRCLCCSSCYGLPLWLSGQVPFVI